MGYFACGFAFNQAPDWKGLAALFPAYRLRGFKQRGGTLHLLDVSDPGAESRDKHWPFTGYLELKSAADADHGLVAAAFDGIVELLGFNYLYPPGLIGVAPAVARAAQAQTFFFRVNDDEYHCACLAQPGGGTEPMIALRCRMDSLRLELQADRRLLAQFYEPEDYGDEDESPDDDPEAAEDMLAALAAIEGVEVGPELPAVDGFTIYQELTELWPPAWGDREALLGWGTFDPFLDLDKHFEPVFG